MPKFQFSSEAHLNAVRMIASGVSGCADKAFDILAADVERQQRIGKRRWHHKKRGTNYTEMARAHLQIATKPLVEDDIIIFYVDEDSGRCCAREENEFEDGRFEELPMLL